MVTTADMIARQTPLQTAFGYRSTSTEVLKGQDLSGQTALVTGGYSGLGLETVKALVAAGASCIVPARRADVAAANLAGIERIMVAEMDLGDLNSVASFTDSMRTAGTPLNLVINVAGVMATPYGLTPQGWETQFGVNHLGHFALVGGIADLIVEGGRVVSYSSVAHWRSPVMFDHITFGDIDYDPWVAYGQSKTANALFAVALDARAASRGIHAYSVHPGGILTELQRHMPPQELLERGWIDEQGNPNPMFKTIPEGAATGLWAATAPELLDRGGVYCEDCSIKGVVPPDYSDFATGGVKEWAIDVDAAERLYALSVQATGVAPFDA